MENSRNTLMLSNHISSLEALFNKHHSSYAFSAVKESLETLEQYLNQFITHSGFSNRALQINDGNVTIMDFARITKGNTEKQIPKLEINISTTEESNWIEFDNIPAFKYVGIGQVFSFDLKESSVLEAQGLMQAVYEGNKQDFYKHVEDMIIKGLLFSYKRQQKNDGMKEKLIDRSIEVATKAHELPSLLKAWFKEDTYLQERIKAIGAVMINHIHENDYFNAQLRSFSDKTTNGGFFQYAYLAGALTNDQRVETLQIAETNIFDAIVFVQMNVRSVESLIVEGEDKERILEKITKMGALEFTDLVKSRTIYRAFLEKEPKVFSVYFTLAVLFDVGVVDRYSRLIDMVMEAEENGTTPDTNSILDRLNGFIRLHNVFRLLMQPSSFTHLLPTTMHNYLTNAQPSADNRDEYTYNLDNFNVIIDCYTPIQLNHQAKKYELNRFILDNRLPTYFEFEQKNTIFTDALFNGIKILDAKIKIIKSSHELLELSKALDMNLNFLAEPAKSQAKYIFSVEWKDKTYGLSFDVFDENSFSLNNPDIPLADQEIFMIATQLQKKLMKERKYIKAIYKAIEA